MSAKTFGPFGPFANGAVLALLASNFVDTGGSPFPGGSYTPKAQPTVTSSDSSILSVGTVPADGLQTPLTVLKPGTVTLTMTVDGVTELAIVNIVPAGLGGFDLSVVLSTPPPTPPAGS